MFDVVLHDPKLKKKQTSEDLKQPFPVPIATITGIKANNSLWRFYHGRLDSSRKIVLVEDPQEANFLRILGFFGSHPKEKKNCVENQLKRHRLVILEDIFKPAETDVKASSIQQNSTILKDSATEQPLQLCCVEAFFLTFGLGCLLVNRSNFSLSTTTRERCCNICIDDLWSVFCSYDKEFPYQYAVYHHFRSKGYVVKTGTKFGVDFLLYKEGPPFYHAQYSVRIIPPHKTITWQFLSGLNRVTESAGKELLLAQISENNQESSECKPNQTSVKEKLRNIRVREVLLRRWVPSQERA